MRKVYLGILYTVTVICIIAGAGYHIGKFAIAGINFFNNSKSVVTNGEANLDASYDNVKININCDLGDIKITRGDKFCVKYDEYEELKTVVNQNAEEITVTQKSKSKSISGIKDLDIDIVVTIPEGMKIDNLTVQNNLGDITVEGIDVVNCKILEDLGSVKVKECKGFDNLVVNNDLGEININDCGNFDDFDIKLEVSLGDIKFFGNKYSGSYNVNNNSGKVLNVSNSLGSIKIQ